MKSNRYKKKLSAFLVFIILAGTIQFNAFATTANNEGDLNCQHEHDEYCGYAEAIEGHECEHVHDEKCGYTEGTEEIPCNMECEDTDGDRIIDHNPECQYTAAVEGTPCEHEHNEECGYVEAVEEKTCGHVHGPECYVSGNLKTTKFYGGGGKRR